MNREELIARLKPIVSIYAQNRQALESLMRRRILSRPENKFCQFGGCYSGCRRVL